MSNLLALMGLFAKRNMITRIMYTKRCLIQNCDHKDQFMLHLIKVVIPPKTGVIMDSLCH